MTVESTAWILTLKRLSRPLPLRPAEKLGLAFLEMPQHRPEQLLEKLRVASLVRVGESVFGRWSDAETR